MDHFNNILKALNITDERYEFKDTEEESPTNISLCFSDSGHMPGLFLDLHDCEDSFASAWFQKKSDVKDFLDKFKELYERLPD